MSHLLGITFCRKWRLKYIRNLVDHTPHPHIYKDSDCLEDKKDVGKGKNKVNIREKEGKVKQKR